MDPTVDEAGPWNPPSVSSEYIEVTTATSTMASRLPLKQTISASELQKLRVKASEFYKFDLEVMDQHAEFCFNDWVEYSRPPGVFFLKTDQYLGDDTCDANGDAPDDDITPEDDVLAGKDSVMNQNTVHDESSCSKKATRDRRVWRADIRQCAPPTPQSMFLYVNDRIGRNYEVMKYWPSLKSLDSYRRRNVELLAHSSEKQWNLPLGHKHHLLSFPIEILRVIFSFIITVPKPNGLIPRTILSKWQKHLRPTANVDDLDGSTMPRIYTTETKKTDENGNYTELCRITVSRFDATLLRANKEILYTIGNAMLYGDNKFHFWMPDIGFHGSPPSMLGRYPHQRFHRPDPRKPDPTDRAERDKGLEKIRHSDVNSARSLPGWLYYDDFLRFLYIIGPKNAAQLKHLQFRGTVNIHTCFDTTCAGTCDHMTQDLSENLRIYIPFLKEFCNGQYGQSELQKLIIIAHFDPFEDQRVQNEIPDAPHTMKENLLPLLSELCDELTKLQELEVLAGNPAPGDYSNDYEKYHHGGPFEDNYGKEFEELARFVKKRHLEREAREKLFEKKGLGQCCRYCGHAHAEFECYSLCGCRDRGPDFLRADCFACMVKDEKVEEELEAERYASY